ncbi:MAG: FAD-dependent oxidoreductase [Rhodospirillales bacterium]|nr:FAD-dependent oxidoreductase [Rhodospirillales bacterium]
MVEGLQPGGQMTITTDVENYPGFADVIQGPWLMQQMREQAAHVGTVIASDVIVEVDLSRRPFKAIGDSGEVYFGETLIICTGAQARWLGLPSEQRLRGFGVSACATCDGFFFRGKEVCIIGGGNTAVEEAIFLTNFATKVTLIHRRNSLRAEKIMQDRLFKHPKISMLWNHEVIEVLGDEAPLGVTAVRARNVVTGETQDVPCSGFFRWPSAIAPASELVKDQLPLHSGGYVEVEAGSTRTAIPGVFAAGDLTDHIYRQAVTSAGMGCMAALDAEKFLAAQDVELKAAE